MYSTFSIGLGFMLEVCRLTFSYKHRVLFKDLSFKVMPSQIIQVRGTNGSGKTTLLEILAGLRKPQSGQVRFYQNHRHVRSFSLDYLPSDSNGLFLKRSAVDNLSFWTQLKGFKYERKDYLRTLSDWGLKDPWVCNHCPVELFSTGMKRKLAISRLFLCSSDFLLLDEPVNGLDHESCEIFYDYLNKYIERKGMAILVSHQPVLKPGLINNHFVLGV